MDLCTGHVQGYLPKKLNDDVIVVLCKGLMQGGLPIPGYLPKKLNDDVIVVLCTGHMQGGLPIAVQHVQLSPGTAQQAHYLRMTCKQANGLHLKQCFGAVFIEPGSISGSRQKFLPGSKFLNTI